MDPMKDSVMFGTPVLETPPADAAPPATESTEVVPPVETPAEPVAPVTEPEKPIAPETPEAKAPEAKAEEDAEPEYVLASEYDRMKAELDALKGTTPAAPAAPEAKVEEKPAETKPEAKPIDVASINPDLLVSPDEVPSDYLDTLGFSASDPSLPQYREAIAKRESQLVHRAVEYARAYAKAEFKQGLTGEIATQVAVHYHSQRVADMVLEKSPELGEPEAFAKLTKAIRQAADEAKPGTTAQALSEEATRLYHEAGGVVQRFKSQGGKILRNNGAGPGTAPSQRVGAAPAQQKAAPMSPPDEAKKSVMFG